MIHKYVLLGMTGLSACMLVSVDLHAVSGEKYPERDEIIAQRGDSEEEKEEEERERARRAVNTKVRKIERGERRETRRMERGEGRSIQRSPSLSTPPRPAPRPVQQAAPRVEQRARPVQEAAPTRIRTERRVSPVQQDVRRKIRTNQRIREIQEPSRIQIQTDPRTRDVQEPSRIQIQTDQGTQDVRDDIRTRIRRDQRTREIQQPSRVRRIQTDDRTRDVQDGVRRIHTGQPSRFDREASTTRVRTHRRPIRPSTRTESDSLRIQTSTNVENFLEEQKALESRRTLGTRDSRVRRWDGGGKRYERRKHYADRVRRRAHRHHVYDRFHDSYWWHRSPWIALVGWTGWGYASPYYYDYWDDGRWGYAVYTDYRYEGLPYQEQQQIIASSVEKVAVVDTEWLPLGVFALTTEEDREASPNRYVQLSIDQTGNLTGYLYDSTIDQFYELEGVVDRETQRAAWQLVGSESSPIIETGLYNLTQDIAPVRVYYADGRTENLLLVALEDDES
jgi:hypothetical protein